MTLDPNTLSALYRFTCATTILSLGDNDRSKEEIKTKLTQQYKLTSEEVKTILPLLGKKQADLNGDGYTNIDDLVQFVCEFKTKDSVLDNKEALKNYPTG